MPQPMNLDYTRVHGIIADYHESEFKGKMYYHCTLQTPYGPIKCQVDNSLNPSAPVVGTVGDFTIGTEYRKAQNFGRETYEPRNWLTQY